MTVVTLFPALKRGLGRYATCLERHSTLPRLSGRVPVPCTLHAARCPVYIPAVATIVLVSQASVVGFCSGG